MDASTKPHVIIIGSGCSGLLVAQGLKKRGISFSVHDKVDPATRHRNWSMTVYWAFRYYPQLLPTHLQERLNEGQARSAYRYTENEWLIIQNCKTGEVLKEWNSPYGIRVNRAGLRKLFLDGIDVKYGHDLSRIEYTDTGVIAHFADGSSEVGTTLVGADGGNSFVRRQLLGERGDAEQFPQYQMVNMSVKYTAEQAKFIAQNMAPYVDYGVHPVGIFFMVLHCAAPDEEDYSDWVFHIALTFPTDLPGAPRKDQSNAQRAQALRSFADDMSEPRRSILKWLPDNQEVPFDPIKLWEPTPWDNHGGRITLAGDAAHAISFHRGQGWNNATTDCAHFVTAMEKVATGKQNLVDAIGDYETEVIERGIREVSLSRELTNSVHQWDRFLQSPVIVQGGNEPRANKQLQV